MPVAAQAGVVDQGAVAAQVVLVAQAVMGAWAGRAVMVVVVEAALQALQAVAAHPARW